MCESWWCARVIRTLINTQRGGVSLSSSLARGNKSRHLFCVPLKDPGTIHHLVHRRPCSAPLSSVHRRALIVVDPSCARQCAYSRKHKLQQYPTTHNGRVVERVTQPLVRRVLSDIL